MILGESENVVEGITGSFSLNLNPGKYVVSCPTGDAEDQGTLLASGTASTKPTGASAALLEQATNGYKAYVDRRSRAAARRRHTLRRVRSKAATSRGPRNCSGRHGSTTRRSSRSPRASATSIPRSTRASTTSKSSANGRASIASSRPCGKQNTTRGTEAYARQADGATSTRWRGKVQHAATAAGTAGQRRGRADERGRQLEDHRRGGPLLAHRPVRLRGQPGRLAQGLRAADPGAAPDGPRQAGERRSSSASRRCRAASTRYRRQTPLGFALLRRADARRTAATLAREVGALDEPLSTVAAKVSGA